MRWNLWKFIDHKLWTVAAKRKPKANAPQPQRNVRDERKGWNEGRKREWNIFGYSGRFDRIRSEVWNEPFYSRQTCDHPHTDTTLQRVRTKGDKRPTHMHIYTEIHTQPHTAAYHNSIMQIRPARETYRAECLRPA